MTQPHRYPFEHLRADYLRAGGGVVLCLAPFAVGMPLSGGAWVLLGCAALFLLYGLRTGMRQMTRVWVTDDGIVSDGPIKTRIAWETLEDVRLSYFSTRRGPASGWLQLRLKGAGATIRLESTLTGFDDVVRCALRKAGERSLALNAATQNNISAMGLVTADG